MYFIQTTKLIRISRYVGLRLLRTPQLTSEYTQIEVMSRERKLLFVSLQSLMGNKVWSATWEAVDVSTLVVDDFHTIFTWSIYDILNYFRWQPLNSKALLVI